MPGAPQKRPEHAIFVTRTGRARIGGNPQPAITSSLPPWAQKRDLRSRAGLRRTTSNPDTLSAPDFKHGLSEREREAQIGVDCQPLRWVVS